MIAEDTGEGGHGAVEALRDDGVGFKDGLAQRFSIGSGGDFLKGWADEFGTVKGVAAGTGEAGEKRLAPRGVSGFESMFGLFLRGEFDKVGFCQMGGSGAAVEGRFNHAGGEGFETISWSLRVGRWSGAASFRRW